jgi:DNA mismatch repair protein MutL
MTASRDRKTPWIKPLPERAVNKIAAGEVVERPAAVVKELVENSLDAGARRIDISIEKAGVKLIKISDDGCGILEEQVEIAFGRHATSKISSFDDLYALQSFGFRGEALPSIASVSRLRLVTRTASASNGTELIIEAGVVQSRKPIAAPPGTTIEVQDLFYNTPARRKFLRAEVTESRYLSRTATALAIGSPAIGFSYTVNGRRIFSVPEGQTLSERVRSLLGSKGKFFEIEQDAGPVKIIGCLGMPEAAGHNRYGQYLFINGRYIFSTVLAHAIRVGYGELIPGGNYPIGAICLTVDPADIDVNVHPSKTEVRLSKERDIHEAVRRTVREALRQDGVIPGLGTGRSADRSGGEASAGRSSHGSPEKTHPGGAGSRNDDIVIPGVANQAPGNTEFLAELYRQAPEVSPSKIVRVDTDTGEVLPSDEAATKMPPTAPRSSTGPSSGFRLIGRFSRLYLLVQAGEDLYIVDQHTAHERVLYEEMLRRVEASAVDGQNLLFPVPVELTPEQLAVFESSGELLAASGFAVAPFGGRMVNIEAMPVILARKSPEKILRAVLDDIGGERKSGADLRKAMAQSMACRAAVMAGDRLDDTEATGLVERLLKCDNKYSCPHGRPTFIRFSREDLDRQFGRE